ncbi:MAG: hypothetical protein H6730_36775 [Deltaproteobacteria bacterium]|nr:hypothetical protein [Deltaproteobacteria bacterium]
MKKFLLIGSLFGAFAFAASFASAEPTIPAPAPAVEEVLACTVEAPATEDAEEVMVVCGPGTHCCRFLSDTVPGAPHICTGCCR